MKLVLLTFQENEQAEKKKAAAVPGQIRRQSTGDQEDEYVVEQVCYV